MILHTDTPFAPERCFAVLQAHALRATSGVNLGEPLADLDAIVLGDGYTLHADPKPREMHLVQVRDKPGQYRTSRDGEPEPRGTLMRLTCQLTLMTQTGAITDLLMFVSDGPVRRAYISPVGPLARSQEYTLLKIDTAAQDAPVRIADSRGLSFARGTRITMASGAQVEVERVALGDKVLTRDAGMAPIAWIGRRTVRAVGAFAPVVIGPHALGNAEALIVSQSHRMMLSDWRAEVMTGGRDVLIGAHDLINDDTIHLREGGFVEYIQIALDRHQIIYAESVPTESLHITDTLRATLPEHISARLPAEALPCRTPLSAKQAQEFLRQTGRR